MVNDVCKTNAMFLPLQREGFESRSDHLKAASSSSYPPLALLALNSCGFMRILRPPGDTMNAFLLCHSGAALVLISDKTKAFKLVKIYILVEFTDLHTRDENQPKASKHYNIK